MNAKADTNGEEVKADAKENGEEDHDEVDEEEDHDEEEDQDQDKEEEDKEEAGVEAVKAEQPASAAADDEADVPNDGDEAKGCEARPERRRLPPDERARGSDDDRGVCEVNESVRRVDAS